MTSNISLTVTLSVIMVLMMSKVITIKSHRAMIGQVTILTWGYTRQKIQTQFYTLMFRVNVMLISMAISFIYILTVTILKRIIMSLIFLSTMLLNQAMSIPMMVYDMDPRLTPT